MLPEMSPAVERAIALGQGLARAEGHDLVRPLHLLHGLLGEEEGQAAQRAIAAGLDWAAYRDALPLPIEGPELPLHPGCHLALRSARGLAIEYSGDRVVIGEVLLLALVRSDLEARQHLEAFAFRAPQLEAHLAADKPPSLELEEPLQALPTAELVDLDRIVDAAANRAREAIRVVEDYCRFALDDAFLCGELKRLRHELTETLAGFSPSELLAARETERDVGTALATAREQIRQSPRDVAQVNCKRLQEALRSLEEYGKVRSPERGAALEQLRYRAYTLERLIVLGAAARDRLAHARLYLLVSAAQCCRSLEETIRESLAGGVEIVQLREKGLNDQALLDRARQLRRWTTDANALFIVNDRPDIARLVEADGVHLGQDDLPVREARRIVGPDRLIGVSTHNLGQLERALRDGASYVGIGPTFPSGTKEFSALAGLDYVRAATAATSLPAFVIGGINLETIGAAMAAGARRVAVSQAILRSEDPRSIARQLRYALEASPG